MSRLESSLIGCKAPHRTPVLAALLAVVAITTSCAVSSGPFTATHSVCAQPGTSIARVDVTVTAASPGANLGIRFPVLFTDESEFGYHEVWYDQPLATGQTFTIADVPTGMVDPGHCLDVLMTEGMEITVTTYPAVVDGRWLYYLLGLPVFSGHITGSPPAAS